VWRYRESSSFQVIEGAGFAYHIDVIGWCCFTGVPFKM